MPKRSSSDISSGSDTAMSSDAPDTKPQIHDDLLDIDTKLAKKQKQNQKKSTEKGKCARQEVRVGAHYALYSVWLTKAEMDS